MKGLDGSVRSLIIKALYKISVNPETGKPLQYEFKNLFSYRASSYRVIYEIHGMEITVIVVAIGHRREVYDKLKGLMDRRH